MSDQNSTAATATPTPRKSRVLAMFIVLFGGFTIWLVVYLVDQSGSPDPVSSRFSVSGVGPLERANDGGSAVVQVTVRRVSGDYDASAVRLSTVDDRGIERFVDVVLTNPSRTVVVRFFGDFRRATRGAATVTVAGIDFDPRR